MKVGPIVFGAPLALGLREEDIAPLPSGEVTHVHACPECGLRIPCAALCELILTTDDPTRGLPSGRAKLCRDCSERGATEVRRLAAARAEVTAEELTPEWFARYNGVSR